MIRGSYINKFRKLYYLISNYDIFTIMDNSHHLGSNIRNTEASFSVAERDAVIIKSFSPKFLLHPNAPNLRTNSVRRGVFR
jgi:hypothetical protein